MRWTLRIFLNLFQRILAQKKQMNKNIINISVDEYEKLQHDHMLLKALQEAGVDNWCGYDYAMSIYRDSVNILDE